MVCVEIDLENMKIINLCVILVVVGGGVFGVESFMFKICGIEICQEIIVFICCVMGFYVCLYQWYLLEEGYDGGMLGLEVVVGVVVYYFNNCKLLIFGGFNEIQKNIIFKMIFGL